MHNYKVLPGESVGSISEKFQISADTLVKHNTIPNSQNLYEGQSLNIPVVVLHRRLRLHESVESIANSYQIPKSHVLSIDRKEKRKLPQILLF